MQFGSRVPLVDVHYNYRNIDRDNVYHATVLHNSTPRFKTFLQVPLGYSPDYVSTCDVIIGYESANLKNTWQYILSCNLE